MDRHDEISNTLWNKANVYSSLASELRKLVVDENREGLIELLNRIDATLKADTIYYENTLKELENEV